MSCVCLAKSGNTETVILSVHTEVVYMTGVWCCLQKMNSSRFNSEMSQITGIKIEVWGLVNLVRMFSIDVCNTHKSGRVWTYGRVVDENKTYIMG